MFTAREKFIHASYPWTTNELVEMCDDCESKFIVVSETSPHEVRKIWIFSYFSTLKIKIFHLYLMSEINASIKTINWRLYNQTFRRDIIYWLCVLDRSRIGRRNYQMCSAGLLLYMLIVCWAALSNTALIWALKAVDQVCPLRVWVVKQQWCGLFVSVHGPCLHWIKRKGKWAK